MDLKPFVARGFPGTYDQGVANVGVAGIDRRQALEMVRVCAETQATLYGPEFSPRAVQYRQGSRPRLEKIAAGFKGSAKAKADAAMEWVKSNVVHPHLIGDTAPNRAMTEEQLIDSGRGWCNEQSRVFVALCEVMEIPARLVFLFHSNLRSGHTTAEALLDGRWVFYDVTFGVTAKLPDGRMAEARDLSGPHRQLAHQAYRPALTDYEAHILPFVESCPGWRRADRPTVDAGGELLAYLGVTNYVIEGAEAK